MVADKDGGLTERGTAAALASFMPGLRIAGAFRANGFRDNCFLLQHLNALLHSDFGGTQNAVLPPRVMSWLFGRIRIRVGQNALWGDMKMANRAKYTKIRLIGLVLGVLPLVEGCGSHAYRSNLQNNPECVTQANINRDKVNACMYSGNRSEFNDCLSSKGVKQSKINDLNTCLDAHRRTFRDLFD